MPYYTTNTTDTWIPFTAATTTTTATTGYRYGFDRATIWHMPDWIKIMITQDQSEDIADVDQDAWMKVMQPV